MPDSRPRRRDVAIATSLAAGISVIIVMAVLGIAVQSSPVARANPGEAATASPTSLTAVVDPLSGAPATPSTTPAPSEAASGNGQIRNVVLLLADDLDWALFDQVPRLAALKDAGTTLTNFVVTESLCCPSRTSFTLGQYVHNHKVVSNVPETGGGWETFYRLKHQQDCLPTWLSAAGVTTAHVGKYLNGFPGRKLDPSFVPPAWDHFVTTVRGGGSPYDGYGYVLSTDGVLTQHNGGRTNFLDDVLTADTNAWLATATEPFFLEFASYLPHTPAPAALRNIGSRAGSRAPISPSFNARGAGEPAWLSSLPQMGPKRLANLDQMWTRRLESGETLADSFDAIMSQLRTTGHADDTLVIVTSDNGYHLGTHRMPSGKHTPYREDAVAHRGSHREPDGHPTRRPGLLRLRGAGLSGAAHGGLPLRLVRDEGHRPLRPAFGSIRDGQHHRVRGSGGRHATRRPARRPVGVRRTLVPRRGQPRADRQFGIITERMIRSAA